MPAARLANREYSRFFGLRHPNHDGKPLLPRGLNDSVQRDEIRHIEMADRAPASVRLLQYLE